MIVSEPPRQRFRTFPGFHHGSPCPDFLLMEEPLCKPILDEAGVIRTCLGSSSTAGKHDPGTFHGRPPLTLST